MKKIMNCLAALSALVLISCSPSTGAANPETESEVKKVVKPYVYTSVDDGDFENMEALQLTKIMGNGINLGNTMEAAGASWLGCNANPSSYEHAWGQPTTKKSMFAGYKAAGIDSVRIPVAWLSTMDINNGDYTINDDFIAYVANIVNMALEEDLIVMINDHWDYGWWSLFGSDKKDEAYKIFNAIWDQVGTYFKDYSYKLIFEAGNEEWGNGFFHEFSYNNGTGKTETNPILYCESTEPNMWSISQAEKDAFRKKAYDLIEEVGQAFVDKIRAQGGNNEKRFLLIPGYDTNMELTGDSRYKMPKDPTNPDVRKLLVSVHYYGPSPYSILSEDADWGKVANTWGTAAEVAEQNKQFSYMERFVTEGYGVIIGEYGVARLKLSDGTYVRKENDVEWITNILDNCDKYNYCPMLWDCNGYFKRGFDSNDKPIYLGFEDSDVAAIYIDRNYASEKKEEPVTPASEVVTNLEGKSANVGNNGVIEYDTTAVCQASKEVVFKATVNGASNFKQIGLQTSADGSEWHSVWSGTGFADNYSLNLSVNSTVAVSGIYFKLIFQSLIDETKTTSDVTLSDVSITVK